ncbi:hypothetical protein DFH27DRAFT_566815 [Peziza echinospora]|nr:hypothetical protein DFH27DRAFT_587193 [Peziza echinospora]KAI5793680.1 hypothetical protein DFH27DRAFT_566815 [Peziza echinospora]
MTAKMTITTPPASSIMTEQAPHASNTTGYEGISDDELKHKALQVLRRNSHLWLELSRAAVEEVVRESTQELRLAIQGLEARISSIEQGHLELRHHLQISHQTRIQPCPPSLSSGPNSNHESSPPQNERVPFQPPNGVSDGPTCQRPFVEINRTLEQLNVNRKLPQNVRLVLQLEASMCQVPGDHTTTPLIPHVLTSNGDTTQLTMAGWSVSFDATQQSAPEIYHMATKHSYKDDEDVIILLGPTNIAKNTVWRQLCEHAHRASGGTQKVNYSQISDIFNWYESTEDTLPNVLAGLAEHPAYLYSMTVESVCGGMNTIINSPGEVDVWTFMADKLAKHDNTNKYSKIVQHIAYEWPTAGRGTVTIVAIVVPVEGAVACWKAIANCLNP